MANIKTEEYEIENFKICAVDFSRTCLEKVPEGRIIIFLLHVHVKYSFSYRNVYLMVHSKLHEIYLKPIKHAEYFYHG